MNLFVHFGFYIFCITIIRIQSEKCKTPTNTLITERVAFSIITYQIFAKLITGSFFKYQPICKYTVTLTCALILLPYEITGSHSSGITGNVLYKDNQFKHFRV